MASYTIRRDLDDNGNPIYVGSARSSQPYKTQWVKVAGTLTSIVVAANVGTVNKTAHGLYVGARVTVLGATVDTDLNGSYIIATVPGVDSFTITTVAVANGTYIESTLEVDTLAPRTNDTVWSIRKLSYTAPFTYPTLEQWPESSSAEMFAWDSRTTYAYH